ncbi:hypothetical protein [Paenibacillus sp. NPDC058174]|uniref:hypothetical protein n=1 Tax=Paenibacillus sp. NPDC058174 TaxID=3346366 RepID=UPI0036DEB6A1
MRISGVQADSAYCCERICCAKAGTKMRRKVPDLAQCEPASEAASQYTRSTDAQKGAGLGAARARERSSFAIYAKHRCAEGAGLGAVQAASEAEMLCKNSAQPMSASEAASQYSEANFAVDASTAIECGICELKFVIREPRFANSEF